MAEFLGQKVETDNQDGFDAFGKPVPFYRQQAAYEHCKAMGVVSEQDRHDCVSGMAEAIARDKPYEAMEIGMRFLDLVGTYRVMAVLATAPEPATS